MRPFCWLAPALLLATLAAHPTPALAADQTVTVCDELRFANALNAIQSEQGGEGTIRFTCTATIDLSSARAITGRVTIDGGGLVTLSGQRATQLFDVRSDASLILRNIVLEKGQSADNGGAINVNQNGYLAVVGSTIRQSRSQGSGGAIHSFLGSVFIESSVLEDNEAAYGGGLAQNGGTLAISDTQVLRNSVTTGDGGGVQSWNAANQFTLSVFEGNSAPADTGGGLSIRGGTASLLGVLMTGNRADDGGGMVAWGGAQVEMAGVTLLQNTAIGSGGGVYANQDSALTMRQMQFQANTAYQGGGLTQLGGRATLDDAVVLANQATSGPGGGLLLGTGTYTITKTAVLGNSAPNNAGGGIYSAGTLRLANVQIEQNRAGSNGGGVRVVNSTATLLHTTIYNNTGHGLSSRNVLNGEIVLQNSVLGRNLPANCDGDLRSTSHRYTFVDDGSCPSVAGPTNASNSALAFVPMQVQMLGFLGLPLGVPTSVSASQEAIPQVACPLADDVGGMRRRHGRPCDAGAVERQPLEQFLPLVRR